MGGSRDNGVEEGLEGGEFEVVFECVLRVVLKFGRG